MDYALNGTSMAAGPRGLPPRRLGVVFNGAPVFHVRRRPPAHLCGFDRDSQAGLHVARKLKQFPVKSNGGGAPIWPAERLPHAPSYGQRPRSSLAVPRKPRRIQGTFELTHDPPICSQPSDQCKPLDWRAKLMPPLGCDPLRLTSRPLFPFGPSLAIQAVRLTPSPNVRPTACCCRRAFGSRRGAGARAIRTPRPSRCAR
jgi:hypothetical protein